jgi:P-type conjugative transfer protein TrbL
MKKSIFLFLILPIAIFAADGNNIGTQIVNSIASATSGWNNAFSSAGVFIFWALAVINLVTTFGFMAAKGDLDFGSIMAKVIQIFLLFGFWMMLLGSFGLGWMKTIPKSFQQLATNATGVNFSADTLLDQITVLYSHLFDKMSVFSPVQSAMLALIGLVAIIIMTLLVAKALTNLGFSTLSVYMSSLFFGFGAWDQTRSWAINSITNIIRYSAKYMGVLLIIQITIGILNQAIAAVDTDSGGLGVLLIVSLIAYSFAHGIESFIDGYFTGFGGGENLAGGSLAKSMAAGAAGGAITAGGGAISQVKAAAAAANSDPMSKQSSGTTLAQAPGGQTSEQSGKGTNKTGNFKKSAVHAAKMTGAALGGGTLGAISGTVKAATGFSTHNAGVKTGSVVGAMLVTGEANNDNDNNENNTSNIEGSISDGGSSSSYISGVPGGNDDA